MMFPSLRAVRRWVNIFEYDDDDYDEDRYNSDSDYADGVDDAMDELDW